MMPARKKTTSLRAVEGITPERKGMPTVKVYFPTAAKMKELNDVIEADYEAGKLTSRSASAFFFSLYCRYLRERNREKEKE
jgi:hypothetical protein